MTHKDTLRTRFEREWRARIVASPNHMREMSYTLPMSSFQAATLQDAFEIKHVPMMSVEMPEHDMDLMIKQLDHASWHAEVQRKYPQLRAAYMEYLTHVHMTVDPDNR